MMPQMSNERKLELVEKMISIYDSPDKWCSHFWALDRKGDFDVDARSPEACRWCVEGLAKHVTTYAEYPYLSTHIGERIYEHHRSGVIVFNDGQGYEAVVEELKTIRNELAVMVEEAI